MSLFKNPFKNQHVPDNSALEHAIDELAHEDNPRTRESLYKALLASRLIFHGSTAGGTMADGSTQISFRTIEHARHNPVARLHGCRGSDVLDRLRNSLGRPAGPNALSVHCVGQHPRSTGESVAPGAKNQLAGGNTHSRRIHRSRAGPLARANQHKHIPTESRCGAKIAGGTTGHPAAGGTHASPDWLPPAISSTARRLFV